MLAICTLKFNFHLGEQEVSCLGPGLICCGHREVGSEDAKSKENKGLTG